MELKYYVSSYNQASIQCLFVFLPSKIPFCGRLGFQVFAIIYRYLKNSSDINRLLVSAVHISHNKFASAHVALDVHEVSIVLLLGSVAILGILSQDLGNF